MESNLGFLLCNSIKLLTQNLEKKVILTCFTKMIAEQSCYPIRMTNVSYERGIIVLSFPDISFVVLIFVFQRFEIKSGFPFFFFFFLHCIVSYFVSFRYLESSEPFSKC